MSFLLEDEIRAILKKYDVRPTKKHGQSFLKSREVAKDITNAVKYFSNYSAATPESHG